MSARTSSADGVAIEIQLAPGVGDCPSGKRLSRWIRGALAAEAAPEAGSELTLRIVDEQESATLNERYRGRAYPTNVLSFRPAEDWPTLPGEAVPVGDLVVCAPVVEREAAEQGRARDAHWAHIVVHGTLHLLGHDHETPDEARRMEDAERRILAGFGFSDPYAEPAGHPD